MKPEQVSKKHLKSFSIIQQAILNGLNEKEILQLITDESRQLTKAKRCAIFLIEGDILRIAAISGEQAGATTDAYIPLSGSLVEHCIASGNPIYINKAINDPHVTSDPKRFSLVKETGIQSLFIVPLIVEDHAIGSISLSDSEKGYFTVEEKDMLSLMSVQAVLAIENARLRQSSRFLAIREERSRLARELHDSITQSLFSITLFTESARGLAEREGNAELETRLDRIGEIAQQALKEMRLLVYQLRPQELVQDGFVNALRKRLAAVENRAGLETRFEVDDTIVLSPDIEQNLYGVAVEALNNILKHSKASTVTVILKKCPDQIELEISDDGVGIDLSTIDNSGMGLQSMHERIQQINGELKINTTSKNGTKIIVKIKTSLEES